MLIIAGYLLLAPSDRARFVDAHLDLIERARHSPGCLGLAISADPVDATRVDNYECWENEESLDAWRKIANPPQLNIDIHGGDMLKYYVEKTGPVFE
jgi:quinol monooxygenase YgiN